MREAGTQPTRPHRGCSPCASPSLLAWCLLPVVTGGLVVSTASTYWWMARSWLAHDPLPSVPFPSPDFVSAAGAAVLCWLASIVVALYDPVFGHRDAIMRRRTAAHWMLVVQRGFQVMAIVGVFAVAGICVGGWSGCAVLVSVAAKTALCARHTTADAFPSTARALGAAVVHCTTLCTWQRGLGRDGNRLARTCRVGFVVVDFVVESLLLAVSLVPLAVMNGGLTNGTAVTSSAAPVADCVVFGDGLHPDSDCRGPTLLVAIVVGCVVMAGLLAWVIESQCMTASQARTKLTAVLKKFRRAGSNNEALSRQVLKLLAASPGVVSELDDVGDFPLHSALRYHAPAIVLWPMLDGFPAAAGVVSKSGSYPLGLAVLYDAPGLSSSPRSEAATAMRASLVARRLSARGSDHTGLQRASTSAASEGIAPAGVTIVAVLANMAPEGAATADEQGNLPLHHLCRRRNPSRRSLQEVVGAYPEAASQGDWHGMLPLASLLSNAGSVERALAVVQPVLAAHRDVVLEKGPNGGSLLHRALADSSLSRRSLQKWVAALVAACPRVRCVGLTVCFGACWGATNRVADAQLLRRR